MDTLTFDLKGHFHDVLLFKFDKTTVYKFYVMPLA